MTSPRALVRALRRQRLAGWSVATRRVERAEARPGGVRLEATRRWRIEVHADAPAGRGTAALELDGDDLDPDGLAAMLAARARATLGPAWRTPPAAAPARVALLDPGLALPAAPADRAAALEAAATALLGRLRPRAGLALEGWARAAVEDVEVATEDGRRVRWQATRFDAGALVARDGRGLRLARAARRGADLAADLEAALADADRDLAAAREAAPLEPGRGALVLGLDAMLAGDHLGVWAAVAALADPRVERAGLGRVGRGRALAPPGGEAPLEVGSDGARPFGLEAAPVGDDGAAVRRFALVEAGRAGELGLSRREAGRRGRAPNGGVRDLVVAAGTWDGALDGPRLVEVRRLAGLDLAPLTGMATLVLDLSVEHRGGVATPRRGGVVRLDLIAALARAARHRELAARGAYLGPRAIRLDDVALEA